MEPDAIMEWGDSDSAGYTSYSRPIRRTKKMTTKHDTERDAKWAFQNAFNAAQDQGPWMAVVWRVDKDGKVSLHRTTHKFPSDKFDEAVKKLEGNIDGVLGMLPDDPLPNADMQGMPDDIAKIINGDPSKAGPQGVLKISEHECQNDNKRHPLIVRDLEAEKAELLPLALPVEDDENIIVAHPDGTLTDERYSEFTTKQAEALDSKGPMPMVALPEPCDEIKVDIDCKMSDATCTLTQIPAMGDDKSCEK